MVIIFYGTKLKFNFRNLLIPLVSFSDDLDNDKSSDDLSLSQEVDVESVKGCTVSTICTRTSMISLFVIMMIVAITCRFVLDWKSYFQAYSLLANGTTIPVDRSIHNASCVRILP